MPAATTEKVAEAGAVTVRLARPRLRMLGATLTVSVPAALVILPTLLVTTTSKVEPLSPPAVGVKT